MPKWLIFALCMILTGAAFGQREKLIYDKITSPLAKGYHHIPVGLCEDYPEETTTAEIIKKDLEFLKKHDIKFLRISFGWDAIEVEKDQYDWLFWDDFVKTAVEDYGITLIPYVCYTPQWISRGKTDTLFFWNYPAEDFNQFGAFMGKLVTRYKKWIKTWELWNEPDISIYWQGTVEEFAEFTKVGAKAVKKADPDAKVVLAGIAYDAHFIEGLLRYNDVSPYVDIINMHNYYETWHRHPVESITEYVNEVAEVVERYGNNQVLWMAEVGYSTFRKDASVSTSYTAYYDYEHTAKYQAVDLFKRLTLVIATEKIAAIAWYEIKDLPPSEDVIGDNNNNRYLGVAYPDHQPKPSAAALQFFNRLFSQKYMNIDDKIKVNRTLGSDSEIHGFKNEDGSVTVVAWLKTCVPGKRGDDTSGNVKDIRVEKIRLRIPGEFAGKATMYNEQGTERTFTAIEKNKDALVIPDLQLRGGEVSILVIK